MTRLAQTLKDGLWPADKARQMQNDRTLRQVRCRVGQNIPRQIKLFATARPDRAQPWRWIFQPRRTQKTAQFSARAGDNDVNYPQSYPQLSADTTAGAIDPPLTHIMVAQLAMSISRIIAGPECKMKTATVLSVALAVALASLTSGCSLPKGAGGTKQILAGAEDEIDRLFQ